MRFVHTSIAGLIDGWQTMSRKFRRAFVLLAENPHIGFEKAEWSDRALRFHLVNPYAIAYDPESRPLRILNVVNHPLWPSGGTRASR